MAQVNTVFFSASYPPPLLLISDCLLPLALTLSPFLSLSLSSQGITKFRGDFKYSRNDWNRTNVISPNSKCRARSSRSPDGVSGDESSREGTPVGDSEERGGVSKEGVRREEGEGENCEGDWEE